MVCKTIQGEGRGRSQNLPRIPHGLRGAGSDQNSWGWCTSGADCNLSFLDPGSKHLLYLYISMCDRVRIYYGFIQFNTHSDRANCVAASSLLPTSSGSESRRLQINASGPSELGMIRGTLERCTGAFKWSNLFSISPSPLELCESESATNALAVVLKPGQILFLLLTMASSYGAPKRAAVRHRTWAHLCLTVKGGCLKTETIWQSALQSSIFHFKNAINLRPRLWQFSFVQHPSAGGSCFSAWQAAQAQNDLAVPKQRSSRNSTCHSEANSLVFHYGAVWCTSLAATSSRGLSFPIRQTTSIWPFHEAFLRAYIVKSREGYVWNSMPESKRMSQK